MQLRHKELNDNGQASIVAYSGDLSDEEATKAYDEWKYFTAIYMLVREFERGDNVVIWVPEAQQLAFARKSTPGHATTVELPPRLLKS